MFNLKIKIFKKKHKELFKILHGVFFQELCPMAENGSGEICLNSSHFRVISNRLCTHTVFNSMKIITHIKSVC